MPYPEDPQDSRYTEAGSEQNRRAVHKMAKDVFQRKEIKYLMNEEQYLAIRERLAPIAADDAYGETEILNTYFDTPDFRLIRRGMEHPEYKEKLRLRCYSVPGNESPSFIEIKKKFRGIVYKRRIQVPYEEAQDYLLNGVLPPKFDREGFYDAETPASEAQIQKEIDYFLTYYKNLRPAMGIAYDRIAMVGRQDPELRITFDTNLRWSVDELDLRFGNHGRQILEPGQHLMELKITGSMDLRIARILSELGIYRTSISKYGRGFEAYVMQQQEQSRTVYVIFSSPAEVRSA